MKKQRKAKARKVIELLLAIVVCNLAGVIGSFFTSPAVRTWYTTIQRPSFSPPDWVFAPVWTTLFILMGISLFLVWNKGLKTKGVKIALVFFFIQLVLNALWSIIFFGLKSPLGGFIELCFLWAMILAAIITFYRVSRPAAYLLIPYILWVSFAGVLNFMIFYLNM
ncbi:tryptophan-rich sensory protein [Candidatus Woesearchaeota archaeon]|nr:tryptophan-rich sensory protein [Candidatus Woesearchaeota archaeon]